MCHLIKWANYKEEDILKMYLHTVIKRYNWFKKDREEEEKKETSKMICPLMNNKKTKAKTKRR